MIQLQALNNILKNDNIEEYIGLGVQPRDFGEYQREYEFILNHYKTYNKVPDYATVLDKFNDFDVIDVLEPTSYLVEHLKEDSLFNRGATLIEESAKILEHNSYEGLKYIIENAEKLLAQDYNLEGTNINTDVQTRLEEIDRKSKLNGLLGISTGMKELDNILGGWLPGEELVTIVGRVNQGKSWLLQKFLTEAHNQGKKVLHYSGEMGALQVAYRHDTLAMNFSNRQLMFGTIRDADFDKYKSAIEDRSSSKNDYIVITPKDLGGSMLDVPTLRSLIKKYKPDIVGIDQLSLMRDVRGKNEPLRIQMSHITMDLFTMSDELGIPILADAQANRNKSNMDKPDNPDLTDIAEADAIGQNSSRVISLVQTKAGLQLFIAKNRYGEKGNKLIYSWDIDLGMFRYIGEQRDDDDDEVTEKELKYRNSNKNKSITDIF